MTKRRYFNIIGTGDIKDELTGKIIRGSKIGDLLNEQQEQIEKQNRQIEELYKEIDFLTHFIEKQGFKVRRNIE